MGYIDHIIQLKCTGHLNLSSLQELWTNRHALCEQHRDCLNRIRLRIQQFPQRFARRNQSYAQTIGIVLLSGLRNSMRIGMCCEEVKIPNRRNGREQWVKSPCGAWQVCPYCCHLKRMEMLRKFLPCFRANAFYIVTISFKRSLDVSSCLESPINYWDAALYALREMCMEEAFRGAFVVEELAIDSYYPRSLVMPHVHAVIKADRLGKAQISRVKLLISSYSGVVWSAKLRRWLGPRVRGLIEVEPVTQTWFLPELPDFCSALAYLVKPIDFVQPYLHGFESLGDLTDDKMEWFNQEVRHTIEVWDYNRAQRYQHYYLGEFHHSNREFFGYGPAARNTAEHRAWIDSLLEEVNAARKAGYDSRLHPQHKNTPIEVSGE